MSKSTQTEKLAQMSETLAVHGLLTGLPEHAQTRLRQIALREHTSIMEVARRAILTFTQQRQIAA